jgi:predicted ATPase
LSYSRRVVDLGQLLGDPDTQLFAQTLAAFLHLLMREPKRAFDLIQSCSSLLEQYPMPLYSADLQFLQGLYRIHADGPEIGLANMARSIEVYQAIGTRFMLSMRYTLEAEAFFRSNQLEQASQLLRQAEDFIEETGERFYQAETMRMKGETILRLDPNRMEEAEACFSQALRAAGWQKAKALELRAAMSLARLWQNQGRLAEAHKVLAEVYNWFTEGFDSPDLKEAKALLEILIE